MAKPSDFNPFAATGGVVQAEEDFNPFRAPLRPDAAAANPLADAAEVDAISGGEAPSQQATPGPDGLNRLAPAVPLPGTPRQAAPAPPLAPDIKAEEDFNPFAATATAPGGASDVRTSALAYRDLGQSKAQLTAQLGNLSAQMSAEGDSAKLQAMEGQRQALLGTLSRVSSEQGEAGARTQAGLAEAQERAAVAQADADLWAAEALQANAEETSAATALQLENLRARRADAKAQVAEDRAKYRAVLARGPRAVAVADTLSEQLAETFRAGLEGRVADYAAVTQRAWQRDREAFAEDRQSAVALVQQSTGRVADLGRERDLILAEEATQKAAWLEAITAKAQLSVQQAVTPLQQAQAAATYQGLQEQSEIAAAQAAQARVDALEKQDQRQLDRDFKQAQIAKLQAEAAKTGAEVAKLQRRGGVSGGGGVLDPELTGFSKTDRRAIKELGVRHPLTGQWVADARGVPITASSGAEAKDLRESAVATKTVIDQLNTIKAIKKDYGGKSWISLGGAGQSKAKQALQSWGVQAKAALNKAFKFGAMDSGTMELFDEMLGDPAALWDNLGKLDAVIEGSERAYNDKLLGLTGAQSRVAFPRIQDAPRATIGGALRVIGQVPSLKDLERGGRANVSAEKRAAALDQYLELELERTGDYRKASEAFSATLAPIQKKAEAAKERLQIAFDEELPSDFGALQAEALAAVGAQLFADSGEEQLAAEARVNAAQKAVRDALTPRARALRQALDEEAAFLQALQDRTGRQAERQAEYQQVQRSRRSAGQQAVEDFDVGAARPSGARGF